MAHLKELKKKYNQMINIWKSKNNSKALSATQASAIEKTLANQMPRTDTTNHT